MFIPLTQNNINMNDQNKEFQELEEYMDLYVQLLEFVYDKSIQLCDIPKFNDFKKNKDAWTIPRFKESIYIDKNGSIRRNNGLGLGIDDGLAYRLFNFFKGHRYYPNNIKKEWTFSQQYKFMFDNISNPINNSAHIDRIINGNH